jgi:histidinol-phosphatase (PHP family)
MIKWGKFDVLAHLTYPLRYFYSQSNLDINLDEFKDQIDEILNLIIEKNISLEINTAALRQPLNKLSPDIDILKRYKELGGKYVSVGSDAHYAEHLSADIDVAYSAALETGFEYITFFEKRTPMMMKIQIEG